MPTKFTKILGARRCSDRLIVKILCAISDHGKYDQTLGGEWFAR